MNALQAKAETPDVLVDYRGELWECRTAECSDGPLACAFSCNPHCGQQWVYTWAQIARAVTCSRPLVASRIRGTSKRGWLSATD